MASRIRSTLLLCTTLSALVAQGQEAWTLARCMQRAQEQNLDLRNAALDEELAVQGHQLAYWSFLPNLNGAATHGYNWGKRIDMYTNTFATDRVRSNNFYLSSDVTLFQSGRKHKELKQAAVDEEAAAQARRAVRNNIDIAVVRAYLDLLGMNEQVRAAEEQAQATQAQAAVVQDLLDAGRVARGELLDIQAQWAQEEYNAENLRIQAEEAKLTLTQLMQLPPADARTFTVVAPQVGALVLQEPTATEEEVLRRVLAVDPAYMQAQLNVRSAGYGIGIAKANGLPTLSFSASVGTGFSGRNLEPVGMPRPAEPVRIGTTSEGVPVFAPNFTQDTRVKSFSQQLNDNLNEAVGFTLSVPVFNNRSNHYAISRARIQEERARNEVRRVHDAAQRDVQNALTAQRGAYRQYVSASLAVDAAQEALRMADERFKQQAITATDLNQAKSRLQQSQAQLINAKYAYLMAQKSLDILQGMPVEL